MIVQWEGISVIKYFLDHFWVMQLSSRSVTPQLMSVLDQVELHVLCETVVIYIYKSTHLN